jgi:hypothetical protein
MKFARDFFFEMLKIRDKATLVTKTTEKFVLLMFYVNSLYKIHADQSYTHLT